MATKTQAISIKVLALIQAGTDPVDALKQVCGDNAVDAMISNLYESLRSK